MSSEPTYVDVTIHFAGHELAVIMQREAADALANAVVAGTPLVGEYAAQMMSSHTEARLIVCHALVAAVVVETNDAREKREFQSGRSIFA